MMMMTMMTMMMMIMMMMMMVNPRIDHLFRQLCQDAAFGAIMAGKIQKGATTSGSEAELRAR